MNCMSSVSSVNRIVHREPVRAWIIYNWIGNYQSRGMNESLLAQNICHIAAVLTTKFEEWPTKLCLDTSPYLPFWDYSHYK